MSHRVTETWMGESVETLEDLLRPGLRAVCVGINPSPVSVDAGHYYQGRLGQGFYRRLTAAGVLPAGTGWDDDRAFSAGIGFTDIIKRSTARADGLGTREFEFGKNLLTEKLEAHRPGLIIFTFKKTATVLFGSFAGNGLLDETLAGARVFVMPGPYAPAAEVSGVLASLASCLPAA